MASWERNPILLFVLCVGAGLALALSGCASSQASQEAQDNSSPPSDTIHAGTDVDTDTKRGAARLHELLEGETAGVRVDRHQGGIQVRIRGEGSLQGSNDPLYVVDDQILYPEPGGVLPFINPEDVKSIRVLKSADETAIYGSRGGNGVIKITTKLQEQD